MTGHGEQPTVDWCQTAGIVFREPFFSETVDRCLRHPSRLLFRAETDLEELCRAEEAQPGLPPAGFVFHMSRCGSTLVAQMLAAATEHAVLSEPGPLAAVLRAAVDDERGVRWLRAMVGALGQRRDDRQRRLYVKFDAWSTLHLELILRAFPGVPWIFLFRDPVEVLASHAVHAGAHVIPEAMPSEWFGLTPDLPRLEYAARVLAAICEAALVHRDDPLGRFVDHQDLPGVVLSDLIPAWAPGLDVDAWGRIAAAARLDAKNPVLAFEDDRAHKQAAAGADIREAAGRWLAPAYARLREARSASV